MKKAFSLKVKMRIYIRTPLVNKSKMIPHMVEHCAGNIVWDMSDFFDFQRGISWEISSDTTCFEFDRWVKYDDMLKYLFQPIEKKSVTYERKILREELWDPEFVQEVYEKALRKFVDPDYNINHYKSITWEEVKDYHEKYYKRENLIVVNEEKDYKVIFEWFKPKENKYKKLEKRKEKFRFKGNKYITYILTHYNGEHYRKMFFSYRILEYYLYLVNRLKGQKYFHQENYFFEDSYACIMLVENLDYSKLDKEFFEGWRKYIINMFKVWYFQERLLLNKYFYWIPKTRKEVIQICKNFTREEFKELLEI